MDKIQKPTIRENAYGNWYGYLGGKRAESFMNDSYHSQEWHAQEWLVEMEVKRTAQSTGRPLTLKRLQTLNNSPEPQMVGRFITFQADGSSRTGWNEGIWLEKDARLIAGKSGQTATHDIEVYIDGERI